MVLTFEIQQLDNNNQNNININNKSDNNNNDKGKVSKYNESIKITNSFLQQNLNHYSNNVDVYNCICKIWEMINVERLEIENEMKTLTINKDSIINEVSAKLKDESTKNMEKEVEINNLKSEIEFLKNTKLEPLESMIKNCNKELIITFENNYKQFLLHQNKIHEDEKMTDQNEQKQKSATQKYDDQTKSSNSSYYSFQSWPFSKLRCSQSTYNKEQNINFYYFSEDTQFSLSIQNFFMQSPIIVNVTSDKFLRVCINIINEPMELISTQNKPKFAIYSIYRSGARVDWEDHKSNIESLQKKSNVVTILFIRSGKHASPLFFENHKGPQINLRGFKDQIYDDHYNKEQLRELCKYIIQTKEL